MRTLTRGQLARASGVGGEAIRYYERTGLLAPPGRSASGYRRYDGDAVTRLNFIRRAKALGFTLREIKELLALHDRQDASRASVKSMTEQKVEEIDARIEDLKRIRQVLVELSRQCSGHGPVRGCPIIEALDSPSPGSGLEGDAT